MFCADHQVEGPSPPERTNEGVQREEDAFNSAIPQIISVRPFFLQAAQKACFRKNLFAIWPPTSQTRSTGSQEQKRTANMTKGSDLLVAALENEGVERIFGIPGEENLDVVESLRTSTIELVLTRHEQAAAFMAATYGRLTGRRASASRRLVQARSISRPAPPMLISARCRWS